MPNSSQFLVNGCSDKTDRGCGKAFLVLRALQDSNISILLIHFRVYKLTRRSARFRPPAFFALGGFEPIG